MAQTRRFKAIAALLVVLPVAASCEAGDDTAKSGGAATSTTS
ncbi:MAG TPA: hypothetical protein VMZ22_01205 [Acidimicrobiales bacterium]|nr:hypothetical protein [Acidimicrobiales bacterium]